MTNGLVPACVKICPAWHLGADVRPRGAAHRLLTPRLGEKEERV